MQVQADTEVSLFVRERGTGRLVFNSKAIEALANGFAGSGLSGYISQARPALTPSGVESVPSPRISKKYASWILATGPSMIK